MTNLLQLGLSESDLRIVRNVLSTHVPDRPVYVFGSRAVGKARRRSDLDLAIGGEVPLTLLERALLNEGFSESDLPIMVDVVDLNAVTGDFQARIKRDFVVIQDGASFHEAVA